MAPPTGVIYRVTERSLTLALQEFLPDAFLHDALLRMYVASTCVILRVA